MNRDLPMLAHGAIAARLVSSLTVPRTGATWGLLTINNDRPIAEPIIDALATVSTAMGYETMTLGREPFHRLTRQIRLGKAFAEARRPLLIVVDARMISYASVDLHVDILAAAAEAGRGVTVVIATGGPEAWVAPHILKADPTAAIAHEHVEDLPLAA